MGIYCKTQLFGYSSAFTYFHWLCWGNMSLSLFIALALYFVWLWVKTWWMARNERFWCSSKESDNVKISRWVWHLGLRLRVVDRAAIIVVLFHEVSTWTIRTLLRHFISDCGCQTVFVHCRLELPMLQT